MTRRTQFLPKYLSRIQNLDVDSGTKSVLNDLVTDIQAEIDYIEGNIGGVDAVYTDLNSEKITVRNGRVIS